MSKARQIGIFAGLKILEISIILLLIFLPFTIGPLIEDKGILNCYTYNHDSYSQNKIIKCGNGVSWGIGFVGILVCILILIAFIGFIKANWKLSKQINEKYFTTTK